MRLKIKDIPDDGRDWEAAFDGAFLRDALAGLDANLSNCQGFAQLHISRIGENVFARGQLRATLALPCSRCLVETPLLVDAPVRVTFTPEDALIPDGDVADDLELATHDYQYVELGGILRETLILTIPMSIVCRDSCQGLCPVCGQDRNQTQCSCVATPPDPRFAALKELKL